MHTIIEAHGYRIGNRGTILGKSGKPLRPGKTQTGYNVVSLMINGKSKTYAVHHIVASKWMPQPQPGLELDHIDGNKDNNAVSNLEWVTHQENIRRLHFTGDRLARLQEAYCLKQAGHTQKQITEATGIHPSTLYRFMKSNTLDNPQ